MHAKTANLQALEEVYHGFTQGNLEPLFKMTHPQKVIWNYYGDPDVPEIIATPIVLGYQKYLD
ncbi:MAG: hypothetical protein AAFO07_30680 [Bacteroidota bacterium]